MAKLSCYGKTTRKNQRSPITQSPLVAFRGGELSVPGNGSRVRDYQARAKMLPHKGGQERYDVSLKQP